VRCSFGAREPGRIRERCHGTRHGAHGDVAKPHRGDDRAPRNAGELFSIEYAEEKERFFDAAIAAAVVVVAGLFGLGFTGLLALLWARDTHYRMHVAIVIPLAFGAVAAGGWWGFKVTLARPSAFFRTSLVELRRDVEALNG
jgi:uncharacterized membrane protein YqjE